MTSISDAFLPFSGFDTRFVPLQPYFNQAMDVMWAHLKSVNCAFASRGGAHHATRGGTAGRRRRPSPPPTCRHLPWRRVRPTRSASAACPSPCRADRGSPGRRH